MNQRFQEAPAKKRTVPGDWFTTADDRIWLPADEQGAEEAAFVCLVLQIGKGHTVLDAPCGAGRIMFHLARAGYQVVGVDIRPQFVRRGRERFRKAHLPGEFIAQDIRTLEFTEEFHGIFVWHGSFGYFSEEENAQLIKTMANALRRGGRLLVEQVNRERILRQFRAQRIDGSIVTRNTWEAKTQRLVSQRTVNGLDDPKNWSSIRLYTPRQFRILFEQASLTVEQILGFPDGHQYNRSSQRIVVVGRKAK